MAHRSSRSGTSDHIEILYISRHFAFIESFKGMITDRRWPRRGRCRTRRPCCSGSRAGPACRQVCHDKCVTLDGLPVSHTYPTLVRRLSARFTLVRHLSDKRGTGGQTVAHSAGPTWCCRHALARAATRCARSLVRLAKDSTALPRTQAAVAQRRWPPSP